jgi:lipopolysaccharide transport system ATP-binding protein
MAGAIAINCRGLSKRFPLVDKGNAWRLALRSGAGVSTFEALHNVSFEVPKGQFVGILGRNGAGKSTLLRVLGGVYSPDSGTVSVSGALSAIYELGLVGNPQLTGRAYAERLLTVHGFSPSERTEMIADIHEFSELGNRFDDPVQSYSAGMAARLFFSTATAGRYETYLLDEILSVGDKHFQAKCWRRLRERVSQGASGVLVTHDWAAVVQMCETAHVLENGKFIYSGPAPTAVRFYLYGEKSGIVYTEGIATLRGRPDAPIRIGQGRTLRIPFEAVVHREVEVGCVTVIERLQAGYGWETMLMSRQVARIGSSPGAYAIEICVPRLPLEPGSYQIGVHLVTADERNPARRVALDGWSWLSGDGLTLEVEGELSGGLDLPLRWSCEVLDPAAA